jgi:hypothetical protein
MNNVTPLHEQIVATLHSAVLSDVLDAAASRESWNAYHRDLMRRRSALAKAQAAEKPMLRVVSDKFAVGTSIAGRPPHRSGRARFEHPAPTVNRHGIRTPFSG